jgi:hypothetical protein
MELGQDWAAMNRVLYPRTKTKGSSESRQVLLVHHADRALRIVGDQDDLLFATGAPLSEAMTAVEGDRKVVAIDAAEMDRAMMECLKTDGALLEQIETLRGTLTPSKGKLPVPRDHFLLEAVRTWWSKLFPSSFGIYLHLESGRAGDAKTASEASSLLLIFRKGELVEFDEPDFSGISQERREDLGEKVKVLRERHGVPVQGFAMNRADFAEWTELADEKDPSVAWKKIARALRQDRLQLAPFRFSIAALIGGRGIFRL